MEALVQYNYEAQESDELTLRKGDVIKDIKVANGGWWEGTLRDKRGMFPDNFVKVLDPQGASKNSTASDKSTKTMMENDYEVTLRNGSGRKFCRVLYSYDPCNDDELPLLPDDFIEFLEEVEEGWWRGELNGKVGVFPSNFVSPPGTVDETDRSRDKKATREYCRVLYPYEASNEDELTIIEGDIITLLSRDAPDKGWWKGELKGQVGLFPDNFVEVIPLKNEQYSDSQANQMSMSKSLLKHQVNKKKETAGIRKSLDMKNLRSDSMSKKSTSSLSLTLSDVSGADKKPSNTLMNSLALKRMIDDSSSNNSHNNESIATGLGEELDEVERGEGVPLSHLTASRAKAPRRRLPSAQHLRHNVTIPPVPATTIAAYNNVTVMDGNMTNGNVELSEAVVKEDESDGLLSKKKKAPWVEELKLNQIERKKGNAEKLDKGETKKERVFSWLTSPSNNAEALPDSDGDENKLKEKKKEKEKSHKIEPTPPSDQSTSSPVSNMPAYIPYHLYAPLLDRIAILEEKQTILQRKVNQLSEQLAVYADNAASDKN